jgi:hypothetical protein
MCRIRLRALVGPDVDDPRLNELVGGLSVRSEHFRKLWARHDVRPKRSGTTRITERLPRPSRERQRPGCSPAANRSRPARPGQRRL